MQTIMSDPSQIHMAMQDPDLMAIMMKLSGMMGGGAGGGGGGGFPGMGGMGGGMGSGMTGAGAGAGAGPGVGGAGSSGDVIEVTTEAEMDARIQEGANKGIPVAVDFTATWCGPCKMIAPTYAALASSTKPRALCLKVDSSRGARLVSKYAVQGFPTFKFFVGGAEVDSFSGADASRLQSTLYGLIDEAASLKQRAAVRFSHTHS